MPSFGRLSYTLPSIETLYESLPKIDYTYQYIDTGGSEYFKFELLVQESSTGTNLTCSDSSDCEVHYSLRHTPFVYDISPSQQYEG